MPLFNAPNPDGAVAAAGGDERAVLMEGDGMNGGLVSEIRGEQLARLACPRCERSRRCRPWRAFLVWTRRQRPDIEQPSSPLLWPVLAYPDVNASRSRG